MVEADRHGDEKATKAKRAGTMCSRSGTVKACRRSSSRWAWASWPLRSPVARFKGSGVTLAVIAALQAPFERALPIAERARMLTIPTPSTIWPGCPPARARDLGTAQR